MAAAAAEVAMEMELTHVQQVREAPEVVVLVQLSSRVLHQVTLW
jgi:hypothetical protein